MRAFKKVFIVILAFVVLGSSSIAYSWWDSLLIEQAQNGIINLGEGLELVVLPVTINQQTSGNLVPESAILSEGSTHAIELTYTVRLDASVEETFYLLVTVHNIKVNEVENPFGLIYVEASHSPTIANDDVLVALTVRIDDSTLREENFEQAYNLLAGNTITFDVYFLVEEML
jgi:hypothetical protein